MKSKYMSRKFIVSLVGLGVAITGIVYGNNFAIGAGCSMGISFIIGEALVDAFASVKQSKSITVDETTYRDIKEVKDGGENKA